MDMHGQGILEGYTHALLGHPMTIIGWLDHTMPETIFEFNTIFQSSGCNGRLNKSWMNLAEGLLGAG